MNRIIHFDSAHGLTYEDTYGGWMEIFKQVAEAPNGEILVKGAPSTWNTLIHYLGGEVTDNHGSNGVETASSREYVEWTCAREPILVDALWRADMKWGGERRHVTEKEFHIATYSGFWRPEIKAYLSRLQDYILDHANQEFAGCVLVPCAADKPYPSPMHKAVMEVVQGKYEIIVVTSALGLVPEALWHVMPQYDAGLPYFERVQDMVSVFFSALNYKRIINYTDMLQVDVIEGLLRTPAKNLDAVVIPVSFPRRCDYQPLASFEYLERLRKKL